MWRTVTRATVFSGLILCVGACEQASLGGPGPTQPAPQANRPPEISAGVVSPSFGIDEVTTFTLRADVSDPDGDAIAVRLLGCPFGQDVPLTLQNGIATLSFRAARTCSSTLTIAASDGRGSSAQTTIPFEHTSLRGWYRLVIGEGFYDQPFFFVNLEQNGGTIVGTICDLRDHTGVVDPHEPGTVDAAGTFRLRFKIQSEGDLLLAGQVISAELNLFKDVTTAAGTVTDGLYAGRTFKLWREAQY